MIFYAVIDTNVFVSALLSRNSEAATAKVLNALFGHKITPLYNEDILNELNIGFSHNHFSFFHFRSVDGR